jgi:magnesium-transporting ATPase (P-type)
MPQCPNTLWNQRTSAINWLVGIHICHYTVGVTRYEIILRPINIVKDMKVGVACAVVIVMHLLVVLVQCVGNPTEKVDNSNLANSKSIQSILDHQE